MSTEDAIQEFAPALRTASQSEAFRIALQMLGDLCGFGLGYFDFDESRGFGESVPDEGSVSVQYDDSIIQDTVTEKEQDMREVSVTMAVWDYRAKWYGEEEPVARARASEVGSGGVTNGGIGQ